MLLFFQCVNVVALDSARTSAFRCCAVFTFVFTKEGIAYSPARRIMMGFHISTINDRLCHLVQPIASDIFQCNAPVLRIIMQQIHMVNQVTRSFHMIFHWACFIAFFPEESTSVESSYSKICHISCPSDADMVLCLHPGLNLLV